MVQRVQPLLGMLASQSGLVRVPAALLPIEVSADASWKAANDDSQTDGDPGS